MDWQELLRQLGSTAIIVAVLGYVARRVIEHWLDRRIEQHKRDLDHLSQRALETQRYELRIAEARQSRLLARQASIIAGVFGRLERLHESLRELAAPILHKQKGATELLTKAIEHFNDFATYYFERAIWLDESTTTQLNDLVALLRKLLQEMDYNLDPSGEIKDRARWVATYERLQKDVPLARNALDRQFRTLLGVVTPATLPPA